MAKNYEKLAKLRYPLRCDFSRLKHMIENLYGSRGLYGLLVQMEHLGYHEVFVDTTPLPSTSTKIPTKKGNLKRAQNSSSGFCICISGASPRLKELRYVRISVHYGHTKNRKESGQDPARCTYPSRKIGKLHFTQITQVCGEHIRRHHHSSSAHVSLG